MKFKPITDEQLRRIATIAIMVAIALVLLHPDAAWAQSDPFATAKEKACQAQQGLKQLAGALGAVGITICLILGYFNKLNWKWLSTGIGVCFTINLVPEIIGFISRAPSC